MKYTDTQRLNALQYLLGDSRDGSHQHVTIGEDEATKEYLLHTEDKKRYWSCTLRNVLDTVADSIPEIVPGESPVTLPTAPLGDPSDRMRLANAIAASLEADPALVDDLRNALTDRVATRLHRDWKRGDDERSHITTGSIRHIH